MKSERRFQALGHVIMTIITLCAILPLILLLISSFTDNDTLIRNGYSFVPEKLSASAYEYIFTSGNSVVHAYGISVILTIVGTAVGLTITTLLGYALSKTFLPGRGIITFLVFFTMLFNGGVVSAYIMWTRIFSIRDSLLALIIPNYLMGAFNIFLVRNYYENAIPTALIESAQIDGASELTVFFKIMLPLAVPTIATVALFTGLAYWNDWTNGLYYITDPSLFGIQNLLIRIMNNIQFLKSSSNAALLGTQTVDLPGTSVRMALAVIGILPILIIFPFAQKYFVKGVVLGAVKG